eukprot:scaffold163164_cov41-Tisochrysis_lutea.AAC.1
MSLSQQLKAPRAELGPAIFHMRRPASGTSRPSRPRRDGAHVTACGMLAAPPRHLRRASHQRWRRDPHEGR